METLIHADIFFFITSIAVVVLLTLCIIVGWYLIGILRDFKEISKALRRGVDNASENLEDLVDKVRESPVFSFILGKKRKAKKNTKD